MILPMVFQEIRGSETTPQTIFFPSIPDQVVGAPPVLLTATSTSGLQITYTLMSGPAIITGNEVILKSAGSVTIEASQMGNENFEAAEPVIQTFNVNTTGVSTTKTIPLRVY